MSTNQLAVEPPPAAAPEAAERPLARVQRSGPPATDGALLERLIANADLAKLDPAQRVRYYADVCASLGLNPLTQPFLYVNLQNKLTLYATRNATDQLRQLHGVSVRIVARERQDDLYVVTAQASLPDGRCDESTGAVATGNLRGEPLANALMKAETKAKRRVTLSICGLGLLDESEVGSVAGARVVPVDPATGEIRGPATQAAPRDWPAAQAPIPDPEPDDGPLPEGFVPDAAYDSDEGGEPLAPPPASPAANGPARTSTGSSGGTGRPPPTDKQIASIQRLTRALGKEAPPTLHTTMNRHQASNLISTLIEEMGAQKGSK